MLANDVRFGSADVDVLAHDVRFGSADVDVLANDVRFDSAWEISCEVIALR